MVAVDGAPATAGSAERAGSRTGTGAHRGGYARTVRAHDKRRSGGAGLALDSAGSRYAIAAGADSVKSCRMEAGSQWTGSASG